MATLAMPETGHALSIGPGGGVAERQLIRDGWSVDCVDRDTVSDEIMREKLSDDEQKRYSFYNCIASDFEFKKTYDYVLASNVLPFEEKDKLDGIVNNILHHTKPKGIIAATFFGKNATFVKKGTCFAMTEAEIRSLFKNDTFLYLNRRHVSRPGDGVHFDIFHVIVEKSPTTK
jgi:2-polyprenyl-3-methyl-5-hydroxy-6-metoxy-1,4-benzoquinol methylase